MVKYFVYRIMNLIGYRKVYFDLALYTGIELDRFEDWCYCPSWKKGTYREKGLCGRYEFKGYGTDK